MKIVHPIICSHIVLNKKDEKTKARCVAMPSPSRLLLPAAFALISAILLIPFIFPLVNNTFSNFTINIAFSKYLSKFHGKNTNQHWRFSWRNPFISFERIPNNQYASYKSKAISPDITKCGPVQLPLHAITSPNCCPNLPSPFKFIDFKDFANYNTTLRVRRAAHLLDDEYILKLEKGIALMKALPKDDPRNFIEQAKVHCAYCNGGFPQKPPFQNLKIDVHRSWLFFPFHRCYIYFFERILRNLIGDPTFALPFWNWDTIEGMQIPSYFTYQNSSLNHKLRHKYHMPPTLVDLNYHVNDELLPRDQQVPFNLAFMYKQVVLANTKELFLGSPYRFGDEAQPGIGSVEQGPHNTVHKWVGASDTPNHEDMGTFYTAARDPIFYAHHSNLDRLWEEWKKLDGGSRRGYDDDQDWLDSEFFFYDENLNLVRIKVRDCLDTKKLGYVYQDVDLPWLNTPPTPRRTKKQREEAKKASILVESTSQVNKFPVVLDSIVIFMVRRPKKLRGKVEKELEEEVLVIEGVEFKSDKDVRFDVHVDDEEEMLSDLDRTEFVGTFMSVPHASDGHKINTKYMVGISKVLENLEAEEDGEVLVTLVPKIGKGEVTIGSIKIQLIPK